MKRALALVFLFFLSVRPAFCEETSEFEAALDKNLAGALAAPDFPAGAKWLNVSEPLSMERLKGKIVLLDFWTYCCINCMHVLPDLKQLELGHPDTLVVVGVHSAKFKNEKDFENIRQSVLRYDVTHPVVNDSELVMWKALRVNAWPTLVLVAPDRNVALILQGEGQLAKLERAVHRLEELYAEKGLNRGPLPEASPENAPEGVLRFPGKVIDREGLLYISDSNHGRVVVAREDGEILEEFEGFTNPQGLALTGRVLYVADTGADRVMQVDLDTKAVRELASTGPLSSPWDLAWRNGELTVALAGKHKLVTVSPEGEVKPYAGSGNEALIDGELSLASLAQPSGLAFTEKGALYVADSEASALRRVRPPDRRLETLVGKGLFTFGDKDGHVNEALLQHPLGVDARNGAVYVADTYNHKIKALDPQTKKIRTLAGGGGHGFADGAATEARFYEPGGLSASGDGKTLYVADTNNHAIRAVDLETGRVSTVMLREKRASFGGAEEIALEKAALGKEGGRVTVEIELPPGNGYTEGESIDYDFGAAGKGMVAKPAEGPRFALDAAPGTEALKGSVSVAYCSEEPPKLCKLKEYTVAIPLAFEEGGPAEAKTVLRVEEK